MYSKNLLIFLSLIFSLSAVAESDWQLVYHHDKSGKAITGSKSNLVKYVEQGRPVRIVWQINKQFSHVMDAGFLSIMYNDVLAQTSAITRQIPDFQKKLIKLDAEEQSQWTAIFSTTGRVESFQSSEKVSKEFFFPIKWYAYAPVVEDSK